MDMQPDDPSSPPVTATTDAVFSEGSPVPAGAGSGPPMPVAPLTGPVPTTAVALEEAEEQAPPVDPAVLQVPSPPAPAAPAAGADSAPHLGDYVRELGQEFQDQQDEGRL
jgi:hypothetical protein